MKKCSQDRTTLQSKVLATELSFLISFALHAWQKYDKNSDCHQKRPNLDVGCWPTCRGRQKIRPCAMDTVMPAPETLG